MQVGQQKFGMQTMNQSLYSLYSKRLAGLEEVMARTSDPEELKQMIAKGGDPNQQAPQPQGRSSRVKY